MRSSFSPQGKSIYRRVRLVLAFVGLLLLLSSILLLVSLQQTPTRDQLRYDPPATLFAPPQVDS